MQKVLFISYHFIRERHILNFCAICRKFHFYGRMNEYDNKMSFLYLLYFTMTSTIFRKGKETYMSVFNPVRTLNISVK